MNIPEAKQYKVVGVVKDAQGIKGEIFVRLFAGECDWLKQLTEVRLKTANQTEVFQIERARPHKNGIVFKLQGCQDRNHAETFKGYEFEIPSFLLIAKVGEKPYLQEVLGFEVIDKNIGSVGVIQGFSTNGLQDLLLIPRQGKEIMVPFVAPFIEKMDFPNRQITMDLPEGLVEVSF